MVRDDGAFARLRFGEGDLIAFGELAQRLARFGIFHAAAQHDHRLALAANQRQRVVKLRGGWQATIETVYAFLEEVVRKIPGFALHVLRQREGYRAGFGGIGQHAQRVDAGGHQLLRAADAIPVFAYGAKGVVGADAKIVALLNLLQHRIGLARREDVARQQQ